MRALWPEMGGVRREGRNFTANLVWNDSTVLLGAAHCGLHVHVVLRLCALEVRVVVGEAEALVLKTVHSELA